MSRQDKGNFSAKHPPDTTIPHEVMEAVASRISDGKITCRTAFDIAAEASVPPLIIGTAIDLQEGRITKCQLGLFGYAQAQSPLHGTDLDDDELKRDIRAALENDRLSCEQAWQIADGRNLPRLEIARACESLHIRFHRCQLGAF